MSLGIIIAIAVSIAIARIIAVVDEKSKKIFQKKHRELENTYICEWPEECVKEYNKFLKKIDIFAMPFS